MTKRISGCLAINIYFVICLDEQHLVDSSLSYEGQQK